MKIQYLLLLALFGLLIACGDDEDPMTGCESDGITYTSGVADILNASCATTGCHVTGGNAPFSLEDYDAAAAAAGFGRIVGAINHDAGFTPMPYPEGSAKIADCDIEKITEWIDSGTPE